MNRFVISSGVVMFFLMNSNGIAQSKRFELFGGYSLQRAFSLSRGAQSLHGWNASLSTKLNPRLAIVTDFSGHYDGTFFVITGPGQLVGFGQRPGEIERRSFMFHSGFAGPQVSLRHRSFTPFARALFGAAREGGDPGRVAGKGAGFAWGAGGGLDWQPFDTTRIRLIQADYIKSEDTHLTHESLRLSFGLVFRF
jgi:hypothetical protein